MTSVATSIAEVMTKSGIATLADKQWSLTKEFREFVQSGDPRIQYMLELAIINNRITRFLTSDQIAVAAMVLAWRPEISERDGFIASEFLLEWLAYADRMLPGLGVV